MGLRAVAAEGGVQHFGLGRKPDRPPGSEWLVFLRKMNKSEMSHPRLRRSQMLPGAEEAGAGWEGSVPKQSFLRFF